MSAQSVRAGLPSPLRTLLRAVVLVLFAFAIFGPLLNLLLWAFAERWYFPNKLPLEFGLTFWYRVFQPRGNALASLGTSIWIALLTGFPAALAERIRAAVDNHAFVYDDKRMPVTCSMGVATLSYFLLGHGRMTRIGGHDSRADLDRADSVAGDGQGRQRVEAEDVGHPRGREAVVGGPQQLVTEHIKRLR